jgi:hypothetical protein
MNIDRLLGFGEHPADWQLRALTVSNGLLQ